MTLVPKQRSYHKEYTCEIHSSIIYHSKVMANVNPFPNKTWFLRVCRISLLKTLWEKEKLLEMSNFSFPTMFSTRLEHFLPFSSNVKLSSANSFCLERIKVFCRQTTQSKNYNVEIYRCEGKKKRPALDLTHSHTMTPFDAPWKQAF